MSSTTAITIWVKSPNNQEIYDYLKDLRIVNICGVEAELECYEPEWEIIDTIMIMTSIRGTIEVHDLKNSIEQMFENFEDVDLQIEFDNLEMGDYGKLSINNDGVMYHYLDNQIVNQILNEFGDFYEGIYEALDDALVGQGEMIKM